MSAEKAIDVFTNVLGNWYMSAVNASGLSGGLLSAWNPHKALFDVFRSGAGILLKGRCINGVQEINILNCYGPYQYRIPFWSHIRAGGLLKTSGLIIGGDLNFTISAREVWGSTRLDPDADFFHDLIRDEGLFDVEPAILRPTWQNGRGGQAGIGKRLDRFMVDAALLEQAHFYHSWLV